LSVRDNGHGIASAVLAEGGRKGHFGLTGMRERAQLAGGNLAIRSGLDSGTEIELTISASRAYARSSRLRRWLSRRH
ncbi:MAG TPA: ATP-binding protein, partial [Gammaproteobacteria bacterium]|nr:ATP-binding protein [Gammaproteobacteria bacterium]